jgi:uncharacterized protein
MIERKCTFILTCRTKAYFSFFLVLLFCAACHHTETELYPSGKLMVKKTLKGKKLDGELNIWYESGFIKQKADYRNDQLEGLLQCWYANGNVEIQEEYTHGKRNGRSRHWDDEGNLLEEKHFKDDVLDGSYKLWFGSGIQKIDGVYHGGLFHGKWKYYSEYGIVVGEGDFVNGTGVLLGYDAKGNRNHEIHYVNNKKQGDEIEYNQDGTIRETRIFNQDKIVRVIKGK